jgi:hypothetical protein
MRISTRRQVPSLPAHGWCWPPRACNNRMTGNRGKPPLHRRARVGAVAWPEASCPARRARHASPLREWPVPTAKAGRRQPDGGHAAACPYARTLCGRFTRDSVRRPGRSRTTPTSDTPHPCVIHHSQQSPATCPQRRIRRRGAGRTTVVLSGQGHAAECRSGVVGWEAER